MAGFTFVGATTPWKSVGGNAVVAIGPQAAIAGQAVMQASEIGATITALRAQAEGYAATAYQHIDACAEFSARVGAVTFITPTYTRAALQDGDEPGTAPSIGSVSAGSLAAFSPSLTLAPFASGTADAPVIGELPAIDDVSAGGLSIGVPPPPAIGGINVRPAPVVDITVGEVPEIVPPGAPPALSVDTSGVDGPLETLRLPFLDDSEITAALDRLRSLSGRGVTIPRPDLKFPEIFHVVGSLLAGDFVVDADGMIDASDGRVRRAGDDHDRLMARLWASRGLAAHSDAVVGGYNAVMRAGAERDAANSNLAARGRWQDEALHSAYSLGVAAHGMMIDLELSIYDAEFDAMMAEAEGQLELVRAVLAAANGAAAAFNAELAMHEASYTQAEAKAGRYRTRADLVREQGKLNSAVADAFKAGERAKQIDAQLFAARASGNEARVRAFEAEMRGRATAAKALQGEAESYKARVLEWEAGVEQARAQYKLASNKARAVIAQNNAEEARVKMSQARNDAVAVEARKAALLVQAEAASIRAQAQARSSRHATTEAKNAVESLLPGAQATRYEGLVSAWTAQVDAKTGKLDGVATEMAASARFFSSSAEARHRAASLTQTAQQQLAEAYRTATEAAARAGAAVESGRLSGYRASASLRASGGLSAGEGYSVSAGEGFTESVQESDSKSEQVKGNS